MSLREITSADVTIPIGVSFKVPVFVIKTAISFRFLVNKFKTSSIVASFETTS